MATRPISILSESAPPSYRSRPSSPTNLRDEETVLYSGINSSSSSLGRLSGPSSIPVTLSWDRDNDSVFRDFSNSREASLPTNNVKYRFKQASMNAMTLVSDAGPLYHISVASNCFIPSAFSPPYAKETLKTGSSSRIFIRDSYVPEVVCIHGKEHFIASVMKDVSLSWKQKRNGLFKLGHWQFGDTNFYWDISPQSALKLCYTSPIVPRTKATLLARFESNGRFNGGDYLTTLEVTPDGHKGGLLEHILVSALILERLWLTPDSGKK
ncbi:hypothetical protein L218DRAFT_1009260 [Marasmius fiardii PR-910]|nr:hypothetical protein L218DRAFT_1009260 [Marasmius fiardii PR-910]